MIHNRQTLTLYTNTPLNIAHTVYIKIFCNNNEFKYKYQFNFNPATKQLMIDILNSKIIALLNTHADNEIIKEIAQRRLKEEPFWIE
jgi:hypothetical protein